MVSFSDHASVVLCLTADQEMDDHRDDCERDEGYEYELMGVTVHTGTADGGHYYCFVRESKPPDDAHRAESW